MAAGNTAVGTGTLALVGPGRAGTTLTLALLELGWEAVAGAGRAPDAPSTQAAAACLGAPATLLRASVANAFGVGPARALTGPVSRGDLATVEEHLRTLDPAERDSYRALAREVARLTGRRDTALDRLLGDVRNASGDAGR